MDMDSIGRQHPLRRLFSGLVEHAFCTKVGMCDPGLTNYVSDLLVNFTHIDTLSAVRNAQDKGLDRIAAMVAIAPHTSCLLTTNRLKFQFIRLYNQELRRESV